MVSDAVVQQQLEQYLVRIPQEDAGLQVDSVISADKYSQLLANQQRYDAAELLQDKVMISIVRQPV